ncbi:hypothetical protein [Actinobacillus porcinus]|uniref:hypothetical protein n=1 Tax=Actinobacillus porcinus TaxID=51048 RepID=UPI0023F036D5|nr:hypothetical protein [Actinobacillus porcinus]MDD7545014.1 hypothetical protein [Actinobacillus porcinus]MDY5847646.1 hypothetical protein [Actinobacillus porcinus]
MPKYGIEVNGIDIIGDKLFSLKEKIDLKPGMNFTRKLGKLDYFTVEEVYDDDFYRTWWNLKRNNSMYCHVINAIGDVMNVNWVNVKINSPYKIKSISIWGM